MNPVHFVVNMLSVLCLAAGATLASASTIVVDGSTCTSLADAITAANSDAATTSPTPTETPIGGLVVPATSRSGRLLVLLTLSVVVLLRRQWWRP